MTDRGDQSESRATLRQLGRRIWDAMVENKRLVTLMILASVLQAFLSKAPLVVIKPVIDSLAGSTTKTPKDEPPGEGLFGTFDEWAQSIEDWLMGGIYSFSVWFRDSVGLEFEENVVPQTTILGCAVIVAIAGVFGGIAIYFATLLSRYFAAVVVVGLRNQLADHLLRLPMRYYGKQRMGELISNLTNNTQVLTRSFTLVADHVFTDPLLVLANIAIITVFAPEALIVMLPAIPLMALPIIRLGRKVHKRSGRSMAALEDATEAMNQMLSGIKTVKCFQLEERRLDDFKHSNEQYLDRTRRMLQAKGRSQGFVFIGYNVAFAILVTLLGWTLINDPDRSIGDLAMILVPITTTYTHVKRLSRAYNTAMESLGALEAVETILAQDRGPQNGQGIRLETLEGTVEMRDVSFGYDDSAVLRGVSFEVPHGTTVALVGPSGAGKSTIVDLLLRLHDPDEGAILIDGHDLRDLDLESYRRHTAIVVQQPFLFNASIYDNIACGRPGATRDEVVAAARAAQIHDFIESLPAGYDSMAGERGSNLSGGQMQRVTIARAIVRDPAVLFLDEAMSALDSESEDAVQRAVTNLREGRTSFVIAHRLSTIRDADLILVIDAGRIVERGTHAELIESGGLYRRLIDLQGGAQLA